MKLFYSAASPYARKVRILLRELNLDAQEILINTADNDPEFIKANPLGKVPALVLEDGKTLFDSQTICAYLDESHGNKLGPFESWEQQVFASAIQGIIDESVTMIMEKRRPENLRYEFWISRYQESIPRTLSWVCQQKQFFEGKINLSGISLACALEYLDLRHPEVQWRKSVPKLESWLSDYSERPSFKETRPTPV